MIQLMMVVVIGLAGCEGSFLKPTRGGQGKPASSPPSGPSDSSPQPARVRYADTNAPNVDAGAEEPDPAIAQLDAKIKQYTGRFPASDLDRKVSPAPARTAPPPAPAAAPRVSSPAQPTVPAATPTSPTSPGRRSAPPNQAIRKHVTPAEIGVPAADVAASPQSQHIPSEPAPTTPVATDLQVELTDVRPATPVTEGPGADAAPSSANQPVQPIQTNVTESQAGTTDLIRQLEETVRQNPQQLDDQFKLRLLYLATGQTDKVTDPFKDVDPVQGEVLSALFKALAAAREALRDPTEAAPAALSAVDELHRLLSQQSPIIISKVELITSVNSFGDYEAVSPARFPANQPIHVFCYIEIANFHTEPMVDGRLRTVLSARLEVFDTTGQVVWQRSVPNIEDRSRTPRRDFFVPLEIKTPTPLPAGEYVLKVTIEDKLGATTDQQRKTFTVGS